MSYGSNAKFQSDFFTRFGKQKDATIEVFPPTETVRSRLGMYQQLFQRHSPKPDLYEIDVIWSAILADDFIDLAPHFREEVKHFDPEVLRNFTVRGRLIALPTFLDTGVLYYRPELLRRYGFQRPPSTWDELEDMAKVIQAGERRRGHRDFWGYVWQGGNYEALTCNAMEWQASAGSPNFLDEARKVHVRNPETIAALHRAVSWIGTISPPGEAFYRELDSTNLWNDGKAAFMRNWLSSYTLARAQPGSDRIRFRVAPLPGGTGGQRGTLGGLGMAVSKYSASPETSIEALRELTSEYSEEQRAMLAGTIPARIAARQNVTVMAKTGLTGSAAQKVMTGLVSRPALASGEAYQSVSRAYYEAVNSVLTRKASPELAMANLELELIAINGLGATR